MTAGAAAFCRGCQGGPFVIEDTASPAGANKSRIEQWFVALPSSTLPKESLFLSI